MKTLRLRLCPLAELGPDSVLEYEVLGDQRTILERKSAVPAALPRLPRTELVVAAPDVLLVEASVPPLSGARLRAALRALAEPHLLSAMETAHVVAAKSGGRSVLAVLDRVLLGRALDLLGRLKIVPAAATPEQLTLPWRPGQWSLRQGPSYGVLRTGELSGMACSIPDGTGQPVELSLALEQAKPQTIEVVMVEPEQRAEPVRLELLQYEFAPRMADWRAWRVPVALAAALALTWIIGLNVQAWLMVREESGLRAQMEGAFRQAFPRVPVVLDPLKQMRRGVAELRGGAGAADPRDFLPLAAGLARALPAEVDVVRTLEFRDQVLRVEFDPRALDAKKREALLRELSGAGLAGSFAENTLTLRAKGEGS
jgi:general secretion pathway protein L